VVLGHAEFNGKLGVFLAGNQMCKTRRSYDVLQTFGLETHECGLQDREASVEEIFVGDGNYCSPLEMTVLMFCLSLPSIPLKQGRSALRLTS